MGVGETGVGEMAPIRHAPWDKSVIQLSFGLYGIHNLMLAALGCVYPVETSTSLYNLYMLSVRAFNQFTPLAHM